MLPLYTVEVPFIAGQVFLPHMMYVPPTEKQYYISFVFKYKFVLSKSFTNTFLRNFQQEKAKIRQNVYPQFISVIIFHYRIAHLLKNNRADNFVYHILKEKNHNVQFTRN